MNKNFLILFCDVSGRYQLSEQPQGESDRTTRQFNTSEINHDPNSQLHRRPYISSLKSATFTPATYVQTVETGPFVFTLCRWDLRRGRGPDVLCVWVIYSRTDERFRFGCSRAVTAGGWTTTNVAPHTRNQEDGRGLYNVSTWWASWWVDSWDWTEWTAGSCFHNSKVWCKKIHFKMQIRNMCFMFRLYKYWPRHP